MKIYGVRTVEREECVGATCDGCGAPEPPDMAHTEVEVAVGAGEEGGGRDVYDYCNDCLVERAAALEAAGSRAPLVTGEWT